MPIMPQVLARIANVTFEETPPPSKIPTLEELLTGPSLYDMFFEACTTDFRRAISATSPVPTRSNPTLVPHGSLRLIIHTDLVRSQDASRLHYCLQIGTLAMDVFKQALQRVNKFGAGVSLEFEGDRVCAYTINFS